MLPQIIVDADPMVYSVGFAAQETRHEIVFELPNAPIEVYCTHEDPRPFKKQVADQGGTILDHERVVQPRSFRLAEIMLGSVLKAIKKHCAAKLADVFEYGDYMPAPEMVLVLTGPGNYREKVGTMKPYKGNRLAAKPFYYQAVRDVLTSRYGAIVVGGREADDEVSIRMRRASADEVPAILATIDKDLDQVPGWHYDYKTHVFYDVHPSEAEILFYSQVLSGDATDNIPGANGLGPVKAKELVAGWTGTWASDMIHGEQKDMEAYIWERIVAEYANRGVKGCTLNLSPEQMALETAQLVKLQEWPGQLWIRTETTAPCRGGSMTSFNRLMSLHLRYYEGGDPEEASVYIAPLHEWSASMLDQLLCRVQEEREYRRQQYKEPIVFQPYPEE